MDKTVTEPVTLVMGPYLGDFRTELFIFRPYMAWISEVVPHSRVVLSSHSNRNFLYEWVDEFVPVYEQFTRDELHQDGYTHKDITQKDFTFLTKKFHESLGIPKKILQPYHLPYNKNANGISVYQKYFKPIPYPKKEQKNNFILYIPDKFHNIRTVEGVGYHLLDFHNTVVACDLRCHMTEQNVLLHLPDYTWNVYHHMLRYVMEADAVICPSSHWTLLCNMQQVPVFSWGKNASQFKPGGIYNLGNEYCRTMVTDKETPVKLIINQIEKFLEGV